MPALILPGTRLKNSTKRPSALTPPDPLPKGVPICEPSLATDARIVEGVHPAGAATQVSRTNASMGLFVPAGIKLLAADVNATKRPSALIEGLKLSPLPWVPSVATETRTVEGTQLAGAPKHVSRTKTSNALFVSPRMRWSAKDAKATKRPLARIEELATPDLFPAVPLPSTDTRMVEGAQPADAPR